MKIYRIVALCVAVALCGTTAVHAVDESPARGHTSSAGDVFLADGKVELRSEVGGDAFLSGGAVVLDSSVKGDAFALAGNVSVHGDIDGSLYAGGGKVVIDGSVARNVRAAASDVSIARGARIGGKATLAGGNVEVNGPIGSHLTAAGGTVRVDAPVAGNVEISARDIVIGPRSEITGSLTYWSPGQARIDPAAKISGAVQHREIDMPHGMHHVGLAALAIGGFFVFLGFVALGILLILLLPNFTATVERSLAERPGKAILWGLGILLLVPFIGVLFIVTLIGIPVGVLLFLLYPLVLMIGYVTAAFFIGDRALTALRGGKPLTLGYRVLGLVGALLLLALVQALPVVGGVVVFVAVLLGLGAWALSLYQRYHAAPAA